MFIPRRIDSRKHGRFRRPLSLQQQVHARLRIAQLEQRHECQFVLPLLRPHTVLRSPTPPVPNRHQEEREGIQVPQMLPGRGQSPNCWSAITARLPFHLGLDVRYGPRNLERCVQVVQLEGEVEFFLSGSVVTSIPYSRSH